MPLEIICHNIKDEAQRKGGYTRRKRAIDCEALARAGKKSIVLAKDYLPEKFFRFQTDKYNVGWQCVNL